MTDDFDVSLRRRLESLAAAVPVVPPDRVTTVLPGGVRPSSHSRRAVASLIPVIALMVVGTILAGLAGVGLFAPGATGANGPISVTTTNGPFELTLGSVKTRYLADEPIEIEASLTYHGPEEVLRVGNMFEDQRPIGLGIEEEVPVFGGGVIGLRPIDQLMCRTSELRKDEPITQRLEAPRSYFPDGLLVLPSGTWHPLAYVSVTLGGCDGEEFELRAHLEIVVADVPTPTDPTDGPIESTTRSGDFELTIRSAKARYAVDEPVDVEASLTYLGEAPVHIAHAMGANEGPMGFGIEEAVLGDLHLAPGTRDACVRSTLEPGLPLTTAFEKSGGFSGDDPRAAEYRAFFEDPDLLLTEGTWHVYAVARFSIGDCSPDSIDMRVDITIDAGGGTSESPAPLPTGRPDPSSPSFPLPSTDPGEPVRSTDRSGGFRLTLEAESRYAEGLVIDATASLENVRFDEAPFVLAQSPLVEFSVIEVGGNRHAEFESGGCGPFGYYEIGEPTEVPFHLGPQFGATAEPESLLELVDAQTIRLPAGTWRLRATTRLWGQECGAASREISLSVEVTIVVDAPAPSPHDGDKIELATIPVPTVDGRQVCMTALKGGFLARNPITGLGITDRDGANLTDVVWPDGYRAQIGAGGEAELIDASGNLVAREGDLITFGGGYRADGSLFACSSIAVSEQGNR